MPKPMRCPPVTFCGRAVRSNGRAKTMKALAPSAAMMTASSRLRNSRTRNVVSPAIALCRTYDFQ
jgi:hypothetical protein